MPPSMTGGIPGDKGARVACSGAPLHPRAGVGTLVS